ncbi:MAG: sugar phosphate isomerase/epimerase [Clostridia bacterium]|nr:sugar phosphate isomerase/epimerase [Clostridia bacterium]
MKISTETASLHKLVGHEKAVEYIAKAGFDAWDFSITELIDVVAWNWDNGKTPIFEYRDKNLLGPDYLKYARKLKNIGLDNGIYCNQSHAPYPSDVPDVRSYFKRAIECTAEAGGKICVIHPDCTISPEGNAEMYNEILPFAKSYGVKIATENMWDWDKAKGHSCFASCATPKSFNEHLDLVNDEYFVACLDIGHAEMKGSDTTAVEMVKELGSRLQALHIHDNDKLNDNHEIPFSMNIEFEPIVKALKEINYSGEFTLEAATYLTKFTPETAKDGICDLAKSARRLADMFDAL